MNDISERNFWRIMQEIFNESELTDELCNKMIELYKITMVLKQPRYVSNLEIIENLFCFKFLEWVNYKKQSREYFLNMSSEEFEKVDSIFINYFDTGINGNSKNFKEDCLKLKNIYQSISLEEKKKNFVSIYDRFKLFDHEISTISDIVGFLDDEKIKDLNNVDIDKELQNLIDLGLFEGYNGGTFYKDGYISGYINSVKQSRFNGCVYDIFQEIRDRVMIIYNSTKNNSKIR